MRVHAMMINSPFFRCCGLCDAIRPPNDVFTQESNKRGGAAAAAAVLAAAAAAVVRRQKVAV